MGIEFGNFNSNRTAPANNSDDRPKAEVWLNIGLTVPLPQEDGSTVDTFVALPVGIPLDTMEEMAMRGNNENWHQMVQAKNWLLAELKKAAKGIKPGADDLVKGLEIQIKRVGQAEAPASGENPILAAMADRFTVAA